MTTPVQRGFSVSVLLAVTLGITACSYSPQPIYFTESKTTVQEKKENKQLLAQIKNGGVQVIQQGSRLQMVLPVNKFFKPTTTQVKPKQTKTLRRIAQYLRQYTQRHHTRYPIKVYGYTAKIYPRTQRRYLSDQYAQVIAAFMWNHGFSSSQMSVVGRAASHPVASSRTPQGAAFNRRVIIQVN